MTTETQTIIKTGVLASQDTALQGLLKALNHSQIPLELELIPKTFQDMSGLQCELAIAMYHTDDSFEKFKNTMAFLKYVINIKELFCLFPVEAKEKVEKIRLDLAADQIVYLPLKKELLISSLNTSILNIKNHETVKPTRERKNNNQKMLGSLLVESEVITPMQLKKALEFQRGQQNMRLGQALLSLRYINESQRSYFLARQSGVKLATAKQFASADLNVVALIPEIFAREYKCVALEKDENQLQVAMLDINNLWLLDSLRDHTDCEIMPILGKLEEITDAIDRYYSDISSHKDASALMADLGPDVEYIKQEEEEIDVEKETEESAEQGIVKLVNMLLSNAIRDGASDVHIEPRETEISIRYRIDGKLRQTMAPPKHSHQAIVTRIKILSDLNIAERRLPQDGQMTVRMGHREVDLRVSVMPSLYGEKVVMRILDKEAFKKTLGNQGFNESEKRKYEYAIHRPFGMVIVTGPTGSGKSTTLYSALHAIKDVSTNIISVEDPVEYHMEGITQVQVNSGIGLTFGSVLRSILRQDPDVVLVGEIRDEETADIAIKMALTGHLVFSTLHTNDAASTIARFVDIGIPPMLLASALNLVIAQRLVRRVCQHCKKEYKPEPELIQLLQLSDKQKKNVKFYKGDGCGKCHGVGYSGRRAVFELMEITTPLRKLILQNAPTHEIFNLAVKEELRTLRQSGISLVLEGETTIEEVLAATTVI